MWLKDNGEWGLIANIAGPQGEQGKQGDEGERGPMGLRGPQGLVGQVGPASPPMQIVISWEPYSTYDIPIEAELSSYHLSSDTDTLSFGFLGMDAVIYAYEMQYVLIKGSGFLPDQDLMLSICEDNTILELFYWDGDLVDIVDDVVSADDCGAFEVIAQIPDLWELSEDESDAVSVKAWYHFSIDGTNIFDGSLKATWPLNIVTEEYLFAYAFEWWDDVDELLGWSASPPQIVAAWDADTSWVISSYADTTSYQVPLTDAFNFGPFGYGDTVFAFPEQDILIKGSGFEAGETVMLSICDTDTYLSTATANDCGAFETTIQIPDWITPPVLASIKAWGDAANDGSVVTDGDLKATWPLNIVSYTDLITDWFGWWLQFGTELGWSDSPPQMVVAHEIEVITGVITSGTTVTIPYFDTLYGTDYITTTTTPPPEGTETVITTSSPTATTTGYNDVPVITDVTATPSTFLTPALSAHEGDVVYLYLSGFEPDTDVTLTFCDSHTVWFTAHTNSCGAFFIDAVLPSIPASGVVSMIARYDADNTETGELVTYGIPAASWPIFIEVEAE